MLSSLVRIAQVVAVAEAYSFITFGDWGTGSTLQVSRSRGGKQGLAHP